MLRQQAKQATSLLSPHPALSSCAAPALPLPTTSHLPLLPPPPPPQVSASSSMRTWRRIVQCIDFLHVTGNWRAAIVVAGSSCCCCRRLLLPACVWGIARLIAAAVVCCCCCCFCNFSCSCSCLTPRRLMSKWIIMNSRVLSRRHKSLRFSWPFDPFGWASICCQGSLEVATDIATVSASQ